MRRVLLVFILFLFFLRLPDSGLCQDFNLQIRTLDATSFPVIRLVATVMDKDGFYYRNLHDSNFRITENCIKIDSFDFSTDPRIVNMVIALDASGSIKNHIREMRQAAFHIINSASTDDRIALVDFGNKVRLMQDFTGDKYLLLKALWKLQGHHGTRFYDALWTSLQLLQGREGGRSLIVFTDGKDEDARGRKPFSKKTVEDVLELARKMDVRIHLVGVGEEFDPDVMSLIAKGSGGTFYHSVSPYDLHDIVRELMLSFRTYYRFMYISPFGNLKEMPKRVVRLEVKAEGMKGVDEAAYASRSSVMGGRQ